jgi:hypothetical protein
MRHDHDILLRLAENRSRRLATNGRPVFSLTDDEVAGSTTAAMRLAEASKSQIQARTSRHLALPA